MAGQQGLASGCLCVGGLLSSLVHNVSCDQCRQILSKSALQCLSRFDRKMNKFGTRSTYEPFVCYSVGRLLCFPASSLGLWLKLSEVIVYHSLVPLEHGSPLENTSWHFLINSFSLLCSRCAQTHSMFTSVCLTLCSHQWLSSLDRKVKKFNSCSDMGSCTATVNIHKFTHLIRHCPLSEMVCVGCMAGWGLAFSFLVRSLSLVTRGSTWICLYLSMDNYPKWYVLVAWPVGAWPQVFWSVHCLWWLRDQLRFAIFCPWIITSQDDS